MVVVVRSLGYFIRSLNGSVCHPPIPSPRSVPSPSPPHHNPVRSHRLDDRMKNLFLCLFSTFLASTNKTDSGPLVLDARSLLVVYPPPLFTFTHPMPCSLGGRTRECEGFKLIASIKSSSIVFVRRSAQLNESSLDTSKYLIYVRHFLCKNRFPSILQGVLFFSISFSLFVSVLRLTITGCIYNIPAPARVHQAQGECVCGFSDRKDHSQIDRQSRLYLPYPLPHTHTLGALALVPQVPFCRFCNSRNGVPLSSPADLTVFVLFVKTLRLPSRWNPPGLAVFCPSVLSRCHTYRRTNS